MPICALIPAVDFIVVFVPGLQHAGPGFALRLWADHLLGFLCLSRAILRLDWNPLTSYTPGLNGKRRCRTGAGN
jgi:hypothetical protein